jgi:hypothetical protein
MTIHPDRADAYLQHILEAIDRATAYAKARTFGAFEQDVLLQDGIIRNIGVIGEAAVKIGQTDPILSPRTTPFPGATCKPCVISWSMTISTLTCRSSGIRCSAICRHSQFKSDKCWMRSTKDDLPRNSDVHSCGPRRHFVDVCLIVEHWAQD